MAEIHRKLPYFNDKSSDFDDIWYTTEHLELDDSHMTKYDFVKIQDGGRPLY